MAPNPRRARFLAIRAGALGDTLLTFPALALLRRAYPDAHVTLVARRDTLPLARIWGLADAVSPFDASVWSALFADTFIDTVSARILVAGCTALVWLSASDAVVHTNLRALGASDIFFGPGKPLAGHSAHAALQFAAPLANLDISIPQDIRSLAAAVSPLPPPPVTRHIITPRERRVALHAGSGGAAKRWSPERFAALAGELSAHGLLPILIEGPDDADVSRAVGAAAARQGLAFSVARGLDLLALAALLAGCIAFVGNDTGVSHLAGLLGVRTLALFGPTDPAIWSPLGTNVTVLRSASATLTDLPVAQVWETLQRLLLLPPPFPTH